MDIFNLDGDLLVTKTKSEERDSEFYKPYPENGKDGVYKALIRLVPNQADPAKSKIHKYYVYLNDPSTGDGFPVDCPSTVGKKSILKDIFWKLKNSNSAADQELAKGFSRKEDYYSIIQIVQDKNNPELEGKLMIWKFGKKINEMIESQLKPEYGEPTNPYDLFSGKEFSVHVRKVGEWNNYDLCQFIGDKSAIKIDGKEMKKNKGDMETILEYLSQGPQTLSSFEYKDWDEDTTERVMSVIRNTVPDGRMVNELLGSANSKGSSNSNRKAPEKSNSAKMEPNYNFEKETKSKEKEESPFKEEENTSSSRSSLDDLYADL